MTSKNRNSSPGGINNKIKDYKISESSSSRNLVASLSSQSGNSKTENATQYSKNMSRREEFLSLANVEEEEERIQLKDLNSRKEKENYILSKLCGLVTDYTTMVVITELIQPKEFYLGKEMELEYEKSLFRFYRYMLFASYIILTGPKLIMYTLTFINGTMDNNGVVTIASGNYTFIALFIASVIITLIIITLTCIPFIYKRPLLIKILMYIYIIWELGTSITVSAYEGSLRFRFFPILLYMTFYPINTGLLLFYGILNVTWLMIINVIKAISMEQFIADFLSSVTIQCIGILTARMASFASRRRFINAQFSKQRNKELLFEMKKNDILLRNILPEQIIQELSQDEGQHDMTTTDTSDTGNHIIYNPYDDVAVLFIKINNFNKLTEKLHADEIVQLLNYVFVAFDTIMEQYGIWRVKTIGPTYMAACGIPNVQSNPIDIILDAALSCLHFVKTEDIVQSLQLDTTEKLTINIGVNHGPLVAGVIGVNAFIYDIWGDTVNIASRMAYTLPHENTIQMDYNIYGNLVERIGAEVAFLTTGPYEVPVKGIGTVECAAIECYAGDAQPAFLIGEGKDALEMSKKSSIISILRKTVRKNPRLKDFKEDDEVLPLAKMAKVVSKSLVNEDLESNAEDERSLYQLMTKFVWPILVIFRNCKLNILFFQNNYKYYTTTNRGLHLISVFIYASSIAADIKVIQEENYRGMLTFVQFLIYKVGVATIIVLFINLLTLTPLYRWKFYSFMPLSIIALCVTILATSIFSYFTRYDVYVSIYMLMFTVLWYFLDGIHYWVRTFFAVLCGLICIGGQFYHNDRVGLQFTVGLMAVSVVLGSFHMFFGIIQQMDDAMSKILSHKKSKYLERKKKTSSKLLNSILPPSLIEKLSKPGENDISTADFYESATVLFSDICNFTKLSTTMSPQDLIKMLNFLFSNLDILGEKHNIQKVKTIGDSYECVAGAPIVTHTHFTDMLNFGLDLIALVKRYNKFEMRVGIASGSLVSGVIGVNKIAFDIFGVTVRNAELLEQSGTPMELHISNNTKIGASKLAPGSFIFRPNRYLNEPELADEQSYFVTPVTTKSNIRSVNQEYLVGAITPKSFKNIKLDFKDAISTASIYEEDINDETLGTPMTMVDEPVSIDNLVKDKPDDEKELDEFPTKNFNLNFNPTMPGNIPDNLETSQDND